MEVQFVASVSAIVRDVSAARNFYGEGLGLSFEGGEGDYVFTQELQGVKHFGLWPLRDAADACFGTEEWPSDVPVPQASIEFEVADVAAAAQELEARGHRRAADRRLPHAVVPQERPALVTLTGSPWSARQATPVRPQSRCAGQAHPCMAGPSVTARPSRGRVPHSRPRPLLQP